MKILTFTFETTLCFSEPVTDHDFVLRCLPKSTAVQTVLDSQIILTPRTTVASQVDGFGNVLQVGRIQEPHDEFTFISSGMVIVDAESSACEPVHPMFLRPSVYAGADARIHAFAEDVLRVSQNACPAEKARRLSDALHKRLAYEKGVTDVSTTAAEAFALGKGVCQDFAHVFIAACRSIGVPARYANGLIIGEGATHAWVEIHDGQRWRGVDPTHNRMVSDDYITLSTGRDFADCPIESGMFRGGARQKQVVSAVVADQASRL